ncbi:lipid II:glycine glycyltransferase FemX [Methanolobus halotolerans]|uniref:GNAT family N-acetyltransferase n=1 Tax=Methanolobus halotolerans TaxID=2052935 RepID=A0A4E0QQS5_9EURY|nr:GNAT family N-acetyltransferase [Methanolobus halotolerans]TGC08300.1 GNAT family N-acetyltransferase [Methanolobus halotolerans]
MVEVTENVNEYEWKKFLYMCDDATIYHTPEWKQFLEKTFDYKPKYLFAKDECGNIVGLLALFYVRSKLRGNMLCTMPFTYSSSCIGSEDVRNLLLEEGINLYHGLNAGCIEIRGKVNHDKFHIQKLFCVHTIELSTHPSEVWQKISRGARSSTKKPIKHGVKVYSTKDIKELKSFFELNCTTKKRIGVPSHPWKFFKNLFELMNEYVVLYVAKYNNEIIAGGIFEYFKDTVTFGYAAHNPNHLSLRPNNILVWKSIEDACVNNYKYYSFGRTSYDNKGLMTFKERWGAVETELYYSYYPDIPNQFLMKRDKIQYKVGTKIFREMPIQLYKPCSSVLFQHLY